MKPLEPDPEEAQENGLGLDIDETFRCLAQAKYAPEDFHEQVMARAAELPLPIAKRATWPVWEWPAVLRLPRTATVALASVLLLCMAGLGYLYLHIAHLQAIAEQERAHQHQRKLEVARLQPEPAVQQRREGKVGESLTQGDRGALAEITLEMSSAAANSDVSESAEGVMENQNEPSAPTARSIFAHMIDTVRNAFEVAWGKVKEMIHSSPKEPASDVSR